MREGRRTRGVVGRRRVVGLPAIMRSSVFRCRSASPYRYVSSLPPVPPPRHPFLSPSPPPTAHLAPRGDQMASPIRVIPNILFLFRNQISRRPSRSRRTFTIPFSRRDAEESSSVLRKTRHSDSISIYADSELSDITTR